MILSRQLEKKVFIWAASEIHCRLQLFKENTNPKIFCKVNLGKKVGMENLESRFPSSLCGSLVLRTLFLLWEEHRHICKEHPKAAFLSLMPSWWVLHICTNTSSVPGLTIPSPGQWWQKGCGPLCSWQGRMLSAVTTTPSSKPCQALTHSLLQPELLSPPFLLTEFVL